MKKIYQVKTKNEVGVHLFHPDRKATVYAEINVNRNGKLKAWEFSFKNYYLDENGLKINLRTPRQNDKAPYFSPVRRLGYADFERMIPQLKQAHLAIGEIPTFASEQEELDYLAFICYVFDKQRSITRPTRRSYVSLNGR